MADQDYITFSVGFWYACEQCDEDGYIVGLPSPFQVVANTNAYGTISGGYSVNGPAGVPDYEWLNNGQYTLPCP
jgi:hypothetical protein